MTRCNLICEYQHFGGTHPGVTGNMFLQQVGTKLPEYTVILLERQRSEPYTSLQ
jgi:hypothetical protein